MKSGTLNHIKIKRLKLRLKVPLYVAAGILESIWQLALEYADDGVIGRFTDEEIAAHIEWDRDPEELVSALVHCGWLERNRAGQLTVHDWTVHCPKFIKERIRKRGGLADEIPHQKPVIAENGVASSDNSALFSPPNPTQQNPTIRPGLALAWLLGICATLRESWIGHSARSAQSAGPSKKPRPTASA